jgi:hypothetical protein
MATSVPNTNTFSLQDVIAVVGDDDLAGAFANSVNAYFNASYGSKTMSPQTLYGFRDYKVISGGNAMIATWDFTLTNISTNRQTVTYSGVLEINANGATASASDLTFLLQGALANSNVRIIIENDYDQTSTGAFSGWTRVLPFSSNTRYKITVIYSTNWAPPQVEPPAMTLNLSIGNGININGNDNHSQSFPVSPPSPLPNLFFPEAYFPNGDYDLKVDRYIIYFLWWHSSHTVSIAEMVNFNFTRTVYTTTDYFNNPWNGHLNNDLNGELCPQSNGSGNHYRVVVQRPGYSDEVRTFNMYYSY